MTDLIHHTDIQYVIVLHTRSMSCLSTLQTLVSVILSCMQNDALSELEIGRSQSFSARGSACIWSIQVGNTMNIAIHVVS